MEGDKIEETQTNNPPENKIAGEVPLSISHPFISQAGLGFVKRDQSVKNEEEQGLLEFIVVRNDK